MSVDATRWAWKQDIKPSSKLILLSLADRAGENNECWPSLARLEKDTGLDRKTIMSSVREMELAGLLVVKRVQGEGNRYVLTGVDMRETSTNNGTGWQEKASTKREPKPVPKTALPSTKNGTTTSTKNGTQNLKEEPNNNLKDLLPEIEGEKLEEPELEKPKKQKTRRSNSKTEIHPDFCVSQRVADWYKESDYQESIENHLANFILACQSNGYKYVNWDAAFQRAIRDDWAKARANKPIGASRRTPQERKEHKYIPRCQANAIDSTAEVIHEPARL